MSKPFSIDDLIDQITGDRLWRIKEITDLSSAAQRADLIAQRVLLRSLVAICYAHWEGYIKYAAKKYIDHIALRKLPYSVLSPQFTRNYFLPRIASLSGVKSSLSARCEFVDEVLAASSKRFTRLNPDLINTQNLSYEVFSGICIVCDLPAGLLEDKRIFINNILLKRRNEIAHGEDVFIDAGDRDMVANGVIELMGRFGDAIENHVVTNSFLRSSC